MGGQEGRTPQPSPYYAYLSDVLILAVGPNTPGCTFNRGLRQSSVQETFRNRSFDSTLGSHKFCLFEWTIVATEIRFKNKTGFNLVCRPAHSSRLPTSNTTTPLATTRIFEGRNDRWGKRGGWIARKGPEKGRLVGRSYIDGEPKRVPAPIYLSCHRQGMGYVGMLRCPLIRRFEFPQLLWSPFSYRNTSNLRRNAPLGRARTSVWSQGTPG